MSYDYREGETLVSKRVPFFLLQHVGGEPHPRHVEMATVRWFAADQLTAALTFDTERDVVAEAQRQLKIPAEQN